MSTGAITFLVILVVLTAVLIALYLFGRKMQKRQEEQQIQLQAAAQQISMFVIDKKKLKMKESGLPAQVIEQTPRLMRGSKVPILKVKVGPQIMNLMCDAQIFDSVPMRKEVKATVSGIYVTAVRGMHGKQEVASKKQSGLRAWVERLQEKAGEIRRQREFRQCFFQCASRQRISRRMSAFDISIPFMRTRYSASAMIRFPFSN